MAIVHMVGVDKMCSIMAVDNEEIALAACNLFQCINDSLTGGDKREYGKEEALVLGETKSSYEACADRLVVIQRIKSTSHNHKHDVKGMAVAIVCSCMYFFLQR